MSSIVDRFMRYISIDTQSDEDSPTSPSTAKQFRLARLLAEEMTDIGVSNVRLDDQHCYVYGEIPSNQDADIPSLGFISHMDTSPSAPGDASSARIHENYDGSDIVLSDSGRTIGTAQFPHLKGMKGRTLITTDGHTLLGADDKSGVAEILCAVERIIKSGKPHGRISVAFTPDEEVGGLARDLDFERFEAPTAYTLDGDHLGYYEYETFNASQADIHIHGLSVHPGTAKGIMKNAADIASEFMNGLPKYEKPQYTEGREGFFHITNLKATCEDGLISLIVRDHDSTIFEQREKYLRLLCEELNKVYGEGTVECVITPQYRSMKEAVDEVPWMVDNIVKAIESAGVEPRSDAFRGGTDGSALSQRGLPCPNLSAGYENAHGRFEYVPVQSMEKNVEILLKLSAIFTDN